jgi:hypothetical protein
MGEPARNRPETILGNLGAGGLEGLVWQFLDGLLPRKSLQS